MVTGEGVGCGVLWERRVCGCGGGGGFTARSPSPERAAVNTQPLGGGSQPRALYLIHEAQNLLCCLHPAQVCNNKAN